MHIIYVIILIVIYLETMHGGYVYTIYVVVLLKMYIGMFLLIRTSYQAEDRRERGGICLWMDARKQVVL